MCVTRSDGTLVDALYYLEFFLLDRRDFDLESNAGYVDKTTHRGAHKVLGN